MRRPLKALLNVCVPAACLIACFFFFLSDRAGAQPRQGQDDTPLIALVFSGDLPPYQMAINGFVQRIQQEKKMPNIASFCLPSSAPAQETDLVQDISRQDPALILSIGTAASLFARKNFPQTPIVFAMVLSPAENGVLDGPGGGRKNITGVSLDIPVKKQLEKFKGLVPTLKRLGFLYDASKKTPLKEEVKAAARAAGLELVAIPIASQAKTLDAVERVAQETDGLWAAVDPLIYNQNSAQPILLETLRNRLPFMAFSSPYVKAGALLALECDYADIGRQAAELTLRILRSGEDPDSIPPASPRKTRTIINRKTAERLGITLPLAPRGEDYEIYP
jgi:putative ABC transport system substrate-binding protein